jgi:hypothetical protein
MILKDSLCPSFPEDIGEVFIGSLFIQNRLLVV